MRVIIKNARNKNIPTVDAFLPSQQRYVFRWVFQDALPQLIDNHALSQTQIIVTKQDVHMIEGLSHPLNDLCLYSITSHCLCVWHKARLILGRKLVLDWFWLVNQQTLWIVNRQT